MHLLSRSLLLAALMLPTVGAIASDEPGLDVTATALQQQAAQIREDIALGVKYAEIKSEDRQAVLDALRRMESELAGVDSVEALSERAKVAVFNDQERINTILTQASADSQLVCRREVVTGSHRKQNICLTVAERARLREYNQLQMRAAQTPCKPLENSGCGAGIN